MKPYVYQEYPRTMHKPGGRVKTVHHDEHKAEALADGWSLHPMMDAEPEPELSGTSADADMPTGDGAEVPPDATPKKKRGRKPKAA